jgi:hypothetical protein
VLSNPKEVTRMRRSIPILLGAAALVLAVSSSPSMASVSADVNIHVGSRPAPVVVFDREPDVVLIPRSRVYFVGGLDYDLFRYGSYWYINDGGYWYRSRGYRGPFRAIAYDRIPRQIVVVPARYHRHPMHPHGGPPGQMKKVRRGDRVYVSDRDHDGDRDVTVIRGGKRKHGR